jgi:hypothetical protein
VVRELGWTGTKVVFLSNRIAHMAFVVGRVDVYTIPACWKEDLSTQSAGTVKIWHLVSLWEVWATKTVIRDSFCGRVVAKAPRGCITSDHTKPLRKSMELLVGVIAPSLQIVYCHSSIDIIRIANLRNRHESAIFELDV